MSAGTVPEKRILDFVKGSIPCGCRTYVSMDIEPKLDKREHVSFLGP